MKIEASKKKISPLDPHSITPINYKSWSAPDKQTNSKIAWLPCLVPAHYWEGKNHPVFFADHLSCNDWVWTIVASTVPQQYMLSFTVNFFQVVQCIIEMYSQCKLLDSVWQQFKFNTFYKKDVEYLQ
jgi:hypothetical protein